MVLATVGTLAPLYLPLNPYTGEISYSWKFFSVQTIAESLMIGYLWLEFRNNDHTGENKFHQIKLSGQR